MCRSGKHLEELANIYKGRWLKFAFFVFVKFKFGRVWGGLLYFSMAFLAFKSYIHIILSTNNMTEVITRGIEKSSQVGLRFVRAPISVSSHVLARMMKIIARQNLTTLTTEGRLFLTLAANLNEFVGLQEFLSYCLEHLTNFVRVNAGIRISLTFAPAQPAIWGVINPPPYDVFQPKGKTRAVIKHIWEHISQAFFCAFSQKLKAKKTQALKKTQGFSGAKLNVPVVSHKFSWKNSSFCHKNSKIVS